MRNFILIFFTITVQLFAFDLGLGMFKSKYVVAVKKLPLHSDQNALSAKNCILKYGDVVVPIDNSANDNNTTSKWIYVSLDNNESIKGYAHRSALMDDAVYNKFLQGASSLLGNADEGLNLFIENPEKMVKKRKGFSEEERIDRKVKKGFSNEEYPNSTTTKTSTSIALKMHKIQKILDATEVSDVEITKFIKDGDLK